MKTKILVLFISILALWGIELKAEDNTVTVQSAILSKYVDFDGQVYYDKSVVQTEVTALLGMHGFYFDFWDSQAFNGKKNYGNEIEYSLGWIHNGTVTIDVGISYYDILPLFKGRAQDLFVVYGKFSKNFDKCDKGILTPFLAFTSYTSGRGSDYEGGLRTQGGLTYSRKVGDTNLELTSTFVRDDGTFGIPPAWVVSNSFNLGWKLGKVSFKLPTITAYTPISKHSGRQPHIVYGANVSFDF